MMLAVDAAAIRVVSRRKGLAVWCAVMVCALAAALVAGGLLAERGPNHFGIVRLWTYGLFVHGVVLLTATAVLWRRHRPRLSLAAGAASLAAVLIAVDAFLIEPTWLEVSHWRIASPKIRQPLRIVVIADLQTDNMGRYERTVLCRALEEKPDIILLAGDYLQTDSEQYRRLQKDLHDLLREISFGASQGVFAVRGNVDPPDWSAMFEGLGVTVVSSSRSMDFGDLRLTCLSLGDSFNAALSIGNAAEGKFHLVLGHSPNFSLGRIDADLLVAGHTHGGQIRLPGIGPLVTNCEVSRERAAGMTELPGGGRLLVSRGIGMERGHAPRLRFLCRPELLVLDLEPGKESAEKKE